ncbi:Spindle assembly checkpoint component [Fagus crenata]
MAGSDSQRQLLTLIRDFASEKSHGERRVVGLKKRFEELRSEVDKANAEHEDAKRAKETAEQELKGYEVESALNESSIQTQEARISLIQDEISTVGSNVEALKRFEDFGFILIKVLKFHETNACNVQHENHLGTAAEIKDRHVKEVTEVDPMTSEDTMAQIISETTQQEEEYQAELNFQKPVQQELIDCEKKVSLMEVIMKVTKALQDITRYPYQNYVAKNVSLTGNKQTSELEVTCASLGEELQRSCICPSCHLDNVEALSGFGQVNEAN